MLGSVSAGKSSSKWLDRLRSSKGFPSGDDLNLEQFLTHQNPNPPEPTKTSDDDTRLNSGRIQLENESVQVPKSQNRNKDKPLVNLMSNVLAELFVMGDTSNNKLKKCSRKQPQPKIYTNDNNRVEITASLSDDISLVELKGKESNNQKKERKIEDKHNFRGEEEEEKRDLSLSGFSRTEVTVIDTSSESWKFEKLLYRKKNMWKVREKKDKTTNIAKKMKKRKENDVSEGVVKKKKRKVSNGECGGSSKERNGGKCELPLVYEKAYHQNERSGEAQRRTLNNVKEFAKNKHSDLKLGKGIILIKNIPQSAKNDATTSRSSMKPFSKRHKAFYT